MPDLENELHVLKSSFSKQLSRDEALDLALQAADLHMKFLRLAKDGPEKTDLKRRCSNILVEAERIKATDIWDSDTQSLVSFEALEPSRAGSDGYHATPGFQATSNGSKPTSSHMLSSSRISMPVSRTPTLLDSPLVTPIGTADGSTRTSASSGARLQMPYPRRELPKKEQIILLKASELHGCKFPPWDKQPPASDFDRIKGEMLFVDRTEYSLSKEQLDILDGWKRPSEALPPHPWEHSLDRGSPMSGLTMECEKAADFVQDAATDCSVVASLATGAARAFHGHGKLLSTILFPHSNVTQGPQISANGKYVIRLNFNGCQRKVVIDDRLPVSKTERTLHVVDRNNPGLLWPALLEKAYLKVRGGYDFLGSNSGTDLWMLVGWIPEQVFLQHEETDPYALWSRITDHFDTGDVMVTLGTGKMTEEAERDSNLAGEHCYAVLRMMEQQGRKMLLIKNPWLNATAWKDPRMVPLRFNGHAEEHLLDTETRQHEPTAFAGTAEDEALMTTGTFWMEIGDVLQHFDSMYLNWNPGFFAYREDIHFVWDLTTERSVHGCLVKNPQFSLVSAAGGPIWLLLQKHFANIEPKQGDSATARNDSLISLCAFEDSSHRVYLSKGAAESGELVDSPQALLRLEATTNAAYIIVPEEEELGNRGYTFTLSVFAHKPVSIEHATSRYSSQTKQSGAWTSATAGGNAEAETYQHNPQYSLTLPTSSSVSLLLETEAADISVHVKLVHAGGQRVETLSARDIVGDSGQYGRQAAHASMKSVAAGTYTVVCSTFEVGQLADFTLHIDTNVEHIVQLIPRDGAGKIKERLADPSFAAGVRAIASPMVPKRLSRVYFKIRYATPAAAHSSLAVDEEGELIRSPIRLSVELGEAPNRQFLMTSNGGQFAQLDRGTKTETVDLNPSLNKRRSMWLVLERMRGFASESNAEERIQVEMFADADDAVAFGVWRDHALGA